MRLVQTLREANVFCDLHLWGGTSHIGSILMATQPDMIKTCEPSDYANLLYDIMRKNVRDVLNYDLRRP